MLYNTWLFNRTFADSLSQEVSCILPSAVKIYRLTFQLKLGCYQPVFHSLPSSSACMIALLLHDFLFISVGLYRLFDSEIIVFFWVTFMLKYKCNCMLTAALYFVLCFNMLVNLFSALAKCLTFYDTIGQTPDHRHIPGLFPEVHWGIPFVRVFWANVFHFEKKSDTTTVYYLNKIFITVFTKKEEKCPSKTYTSNTTFNCKMWVSVSKSHSL